MSAVTLRFSTLNKIAQKSFLVPADHRSADKHPSSSKNKDSTKDSSKEPSHKTDKRKPPFPCNTCEGQGITGEQANHWKSDCPLRTKFSTTSAAAPAASTPATQGAAPPAAAPPATGARPPGAPAIPKGKNHQAHIGSSRAPHSTFIKFSSGISASEHVIAFDRWIADTGFSKGLANAATFAALGTPLKEPIVIDGLAQEVTATASATLNLNVGPLKGVPYEVLLIDNLDFDIILGNDFCAAHGVAINFFTSRIEFPNSGDTHHPANYIVFSAIDAQGKPIRHTFSDPLINAPSPRPIFTPAHDFDDDFFKDIADSYDPIDEELRGVDIGNGKVVKFGLDVPDEVIQKAKALLLEFESILDTTLRACGAAKVDPVDLEITDPPEPVRPRYNAKYPPAVKEALMATIEAGVKSGLLGRGLAKGDDGIAHISQARPVQRTEPSGEKKTRLTTNFIDINKNIPDSPAELPSIQDILNKAGSCSIFHKVDFCSGYHQIPIDKKYLKYVNLKVLEQFFHYLALGQGLKNAVKLFQAIIKRLFVDNNPATFATNFIDDLIAACKTYDEALIMLRFILFTAKERNLIINIKKTALFASRLRVLSHILSKNGIEADPLKVKLVANASPPRNVKEVQRFLGLANFCRPFIEHFAEIAAPLTALTAKGVPFDFGEDQLAAFNTLKQALISAPVLATPDPHKPYVLYTDASNHAIGAVLCQRDDAHKIHPVWFYSHTLNTAQRSYSAPEREMLAGVAAMQYFEFYLLNGRTFEWHFDAEALKWIDSIERNAKAVEHRRVRWISVLHNFSYTSHAIPGVSNPSDAMTRRPIAILARVSARSNKGKNPRAHFEEPSATRKKRQQRTPAPATPATDASRTIAPPVATAPTIAPTVTASPNAPPTVVAPPADTSSGVAPPGAAPPVVPPPFVTPPVVASLNVASPDAAPPVAAPPPSAPALPRGQPASDNTAPAVHFPQSPPPPGIPYVHIINLFRDLPAQQKADPTLQQCFERAAHNKQTSSTFFCIENNVLLRVINDKSPPVRQVVIPTCYRHRVLHELHDSSYGAHYGINAATEFALRIMWWPDIAANIKDWVKSCDVCATSKPRNSLPPGAMESSPIIDSRPWDDLDVDLIGPLIVSERGNRFILTVTCNSTCDFIAEPMPNGTIEEVVNIFERHIICESNTPRRLSTDSASIFTSKKWLDYCRDRGIEVRTSGGYTSNVVSRDERMNRELAQWFRSYGLTDNTWDVHLPYARMAIRSSIDKSRNESPFFLTHGRNPRVPLTVILDRLVPEPQPVELSDYRSDLIARTSQAHSSALAQLLKSREHQKKYFDHRDVQGRRLSLALHTACTEARWHQQEIPSSLVRALPHHRPHRGQRLLPRKRHHFYSPSSTRAHSPSQALLRRHQAPSSRLHRARIRRIRLRTGGGDRSHFFAALRRTRRARSRHRRRDGQASRRLQRQDRSQNSY